MHNTGCLGLVHWEDAEGRYGEGGGRREEGSGWGTRVEIKEEGKLKKNKIKK